MYGVYGMLVYCMYDIYAWLYIFRHLDHIRIEYSVKLKYNMQNYCYVMDLGIDGF
jgi:hypothetical protein